MDNSLGDEVQPRCQVLKYSLALFLIWQRRAKAAAAQATMISQGRENKTIPPLEKTRAEEVWCLHTVVAVENLSEKGWKRRERKEKKNFFFGLDL